MAPIVNTEQREVWDGWLGEHWVTHPDRYDSTLEGFNGPVLAAAGIGPSSRVLDVGCGTGQLTRAAAAMAPHGSATGVDISERMVATARERTPEGAAAVFEVGDAQVHPFPTGGYDALVSRGGVMFFDDPVAAFRNLGRALGAGGRLSFLVPGPPEPEGEYARATAALRPHMGNPSPTTRRMMSLRHREAVDGLLLASGFRDTDITLFRSVSVLGSDPEDAADFVCGQGRVRSRLRELDDATAEGIRRELAEGLAEFHTDGGVRVADSGWVVSAVRA
ncbi:class I SAM-dependent methyltransferase [Nocardiopsis sp. NPDC101807]|uniref:class I SAM-dependent methyltransferase n=1 Tax=Nocardiopsis sp. NPDC101807 TaxID=3364339 RepID=UPI0037FEC508